MRKQERFGLAGATFGARQSALRAAVDNPAPASITFEREPENKYDPNAIRVLANGADVGYVPREIAGLLSDREFTLKEFQFTKVPGKDILTMNLTVVFQADGFDVEEMV